MTNPITCVGLQAIAQHGRLIIQIARLIKSKHGARVYIYVNSPEEKRGIEQLNKDGLIDDVIDCQKVTPALRKTVGECDSVIAKARKWETRIGETYSQMAFEHRRLSRGYFPGGTGLPTSPLVQNASYIQVINAFNESFEFWEDEIKSKNFSLIVGTDKVSIAVCRHHNVPYRRIFSSKFGAEHYWALDEKSTNPSIQCSYDALTQWQDVELTQTYTLQVEKIERIISGFSYRTIARSLFAYMTKGLFYRFFGSHAGRITLHDAIRAILRPRFELKKYRRLATTKLADLDGKPYVYFPLHKEPETNMLVASPEYFSQISAVMSLSRDLPAGVLLVLKEHIPAIGKRPNGYYEQLLDLKNVVLLQLFEPSLEIIKRSTATVAITGTAGIEASVLGKPTIQFGRHMVNRFLSHVMTVTEEHQIAEYLNRALDGQIDLTQAKADGARFREALRQVSFDMPNFTMGDTDGVSSKSAESAYEKLLKSLEEYPNVGVV